MGQRDTLERPHLYPRTCVFSRYFMSAQADLLSAAASVRGIWKPGSLKSYQGTSVSCHLFSLDSLESDSHRMTRKGRMSKPPDRSTSSTNLTVITLLRTLLNPQPSPFHHQTTRHLQSTGAIAIHNVVPCITHPTGDSHASNRRSRPPPS